MRILFITYNFQPEQIFFGLPFARELTRRGHQVQVLTTFPNYPEGEIYEGYKQQWCMRENLEGIPVIRVPLYPSHDRSSIRRILSYSSFAGSAGLISPFAVDSADVAYVVQGPITIGWPAFLLKILRRIPFVFDIKDLWPDSLSATGMFNNQFGLWLVDRWCRFCYRVASKVIVPTPGIKNILIKRGVPESKLQVVYNWVDPSQLEFEKAGTDQKKKLGFENRFNILFAGNMGKAQGLTVALEAAALVRTMAPEIQFTFIGGGIEVENLKKKSQELKLTNVQFLPPCPYSQMGPILDMADVLFVHLNDQPLFRITIPSKIQAYLAAGKPILVALRGDAEELIETVGAGISCEPGNATSISDATLKLYGMSQDELVQMGKRGAAFYYDQMSFNAAVDHYEDIFKNIAGKS